MLSWLVSAQRKRHHFLWWAFVQKVRGIRPIAIGVTLRRLASNTRRAARMAHLFGPRQLGVGIRGGCEAATHSARRYLQSLAPDHIMVKLDFANAFNSLYRSDMLLSVRPRTAYPNCMPFASHRTHSHHSCILDLILSQEGPQQGDPLGPLLFCSTIYPLITSLVIWTISLWLALRVWSLRIFSR